MQNIVLIIHLLLALGLIAVVLLQRSEGGGLGMGGGGGGGTMSSRGSLSALGKVTWALAVAFICTSLTLTIFAAQNAADSSVLDQVGIGGDATFEPTTEVPTGEDLLPPAPSGDGGTSEGDTPPAAPSGDGQLPRAE